MLEPYLDHWVIRLSLIISGGLVLSCPQWWPAIKGKWDRFKSSTPKDKSIASPKSEPPRALERKREAWGIFGGRTQEFRLYEIACLLVGVYPKWPLPTELAKEEYNALLAAIEAGKLDSPLVHENDTTLSYDAGFLNRDDVDKPDELDDEGDPIAVPGILIERRVIRRYLRSIGRPIPEFLEELFDE